MARTLDAMPAKTTRTRPTKYGQFLNGEVWLLTKGEDFVIPCRNLYTSLFTLAKRRGLVYRATIISDTQIAVQFTKPTES